MIYMTIVQSGKFMLIVNPDKSLYQYIVRNYYQLLYIYKLYFALFYSLYMKLNLLRCNISSNV